METFPWERTEGAHITCKTPIENINADQIAQEAYDNNRPPLFGIIGGPPCPDFSNAGLHRGKDGDNGKLSQIFIDRIRDLHPDFFIFENVPGLLRTHRHRDFFNDLVKTLRYNQPKYACDWHTLNALDYGVPQDRKRVFLVGITTELFTRIFERYPFIDEGNWFPWPKPKYADAIHAYNWPTIHDQEGIPVKPKGIPLELTVGYYLNGKNPPQNQPNGNEVFVAHSPRFKETKEGAVDHKSFKRLHRWRYSPTAAYGNNEVHLHPWEPRRLTVREALRIQSVPDEYVLPPDMTLSAKFKLITNGVPVKLANAVAESLMSFLLENKKPDSCQ